MDEKFVALKLILDHLNVGQEINTVEQRLETQKAIYLAQSMGVELGYSYGWYLKGPYSPSLTRDYFELDATAEEDFAEGRNLKGRVREILDQLRHLIDDREVPLSRAHWLELLASIRYLIRESGFTEQRARERIQLSKPHVHAHFNQGLAALQEYALV
jgi:uncharacterized protein YwgA